MNTQHTPMPKRGDRIIILNVPEDYRFKDLYVTEGQYMGVIESFNPVTNRVGFMTGYTPYLDGGNYSCSGGGHAINSSNLKYSKTAPATFWKFKDGICKAHNGENYQLEVNYFECEFSYLKR